MQIEQVIITPFCHRRPRPGAGRSRGSTGSTSVAGRLLRAARPPQRRPYDPLRRDRVEHRLRLVEISAFASLCAQTDQDFDWVVVIDRLLDPELRSRLESLVGRRERTHLHVLDPSEDLGRSEWLAPYHRQLGVGDYLVTSKLDDDDALPRDFVRESKRAVRHVVQHGPPLVVLGVSQMTNWDLVLDERAPLGTSAPWHRPDPWGARVAASGFSLAARQPDYPFTIQGQRHVQARELLDFGHPARHEDVETTRRRFLLAAAAADDDLMRFSIDETFVDLSGEIGPVTLTNHRLNLQQTRLLEDKPGRSPVRGPETFPNTAIDWSALERHARHFRVTPRHRSRRVRWRIANAVERAARRRRR